MIIVNRNLFSIGGGGSSGKSRGGEDVVDGEVLVEGEETRGEGGTGTCNCNGDRMTNGCNVNSPRKSWDVVDGEVFFVKGGRHNRG